MSLANLRNLEARGRLPNTFDDQHTRRRSYGYIDAAARNTARLLIGVNRSIIHNSWGAPSTKLPTRTNRTGTATLATMTCNIATQDSQAQFVTLTKIDIKDSFRLFPDMVEKETETTLAEEFAQQSADSFNNIAQLLDVAIKDAIDTAKATASNSTFVGVGAKYVLVGDALHTIHPLAGQGVNLGLQDVICLADVIKNALNKNQCFYDHSVLRRYQRQRKSENIKMLAAMDGFKYLFSNDNIALSSIRNVGLRLTNRLPYIKYKFVKQAMGI